MRTLKIFFALCFLLAIILNNGCKFIEKVDVIWLVPDGYEGPVLIVYDQDDGKEEEYYQNKRIYRIPQSGYLETKFKSENVGISNEEYFYLKPNGIKQKVSLQHTRGSTNIDSSALCVYFRGKIGVSRLIVAEENLIISKPKADTFIIGRFSDLHTHYEKYQKMSAAMPRDSVFTKDIPKMPKPAIKPESPKRPE